MKYTVVTGNVSTDKPLLAELWERNLGGNSAMRDKVEWYYTGNPSGTGQCFLLNAANDEGETETVGSASVGVRLLHTRNRIYRAALLGGLVVNQEHRTLFPAMQLMRSVKRSCAEAYDITYAFPNEMSVGLCEKNRYYTLGDIKRFVRVLDYTPYLQRKGLPYPLARLGDGLIRLLPVARRFRLHSTEQVIMLKGFASRIDELWERARDNYPIIGNRTSALLDWRFRQYPVEEAFVMALADRGGDRLKAYAVIVKDGEVARVKDFLGDSPESIGRLLANLPQPLRHDGYSSLSLRYLGGEAMEQVIQDAGYKERLDKRQVILDVSGLSEDEQALFQDKGNWHLTDADEDE